MKGKIFLTSLFIVIVMGMILTGCGSKTESNSPPKLQGTIKIGGNFELSGQLCEFGLKGENGAKLAIKEFNDKGGILGAKIEYYSADNKSDDMESASAVTKLVDEHKVIGIIGPMTNLNTLAAARVATQKETVLITPTGTSTLITVGENGLNDWLFRACFIDAYQGEIAANFAYNDIKAETAALVVDRSSEYSIRLAETFKTEFTSLGGSVVLAEEYTGGQDKDFTPIINSISKKPAYYFYAWLLWRSRAVGKSSLEWLGLIYPF